MVASFRVEPPLSVLVRRLCVGAGKDGPELWVVVPARSDGRDFVFAFQAPWDSYVTDAVIEEYVHECVSAVALHEVDECLAVDGERRWEPHAGREVFRFGWVRCWAEMGRTS